MRQRSRTRTAPARGCPGHTSRIPGRARPNCRLETHPRLPVPSVRRSASRTRLAVVAECGAGHDRRGAAPSASGRCGRCTPSAQSWRHSVRPTRSPLAATSTAGVQGSLWPWATHSRPALGSTLRMWGGYQDVPPLGRRHNIDKARPILPSPTSDQADGAATLTAWCRLFLDSMIPGAPIFSKLSEQGSKSPPGSISVRHSDIKTPFRPGMCLFWMLLALASIALGSLATSQSPKASVVAAALLAAITVTTSKAFRSLTSPQLYVMVASVAGGLVGLPTAIHIGTYTGEAALTVAMAYAGLLLLVTVDRAELIGLPRSVTILLGFCVWGGVSFAWTTPTVPGVQNLLVYVTFVSTVALAYVAYQTNIRARVLIGRSITAAAVLSYLLYGATLAIAGPGGSGVIASRSFGLFALIAVSWFATGWRYKMPYCGLLTFVGTVLAALSFSRTAAVCCVLIAVVARIRIRHLGGAFRALLGVGLALVVISLAIRYVPPIHKRFFTGDVRNVGGVTINVEGRTKFWGTTWRSYETSPVYGHGIGSADVLISRTYGAAAAHPHNDYLRLANDLGIIGVALWIVGFGGLIVYTFRLWARSNLGSDPDKRFSATACIGLSAVAVAMVTDNVMTYLFVMAPLGVVTGAALGSARSTRLGSRPSRSRTDPVPAHPLP